MVDAPLLPSGLDERGLAENFSGAVAMKMQQLNAVALLSTKGPRSQDADARSHSLDMCQSTHAQN